MTTTIYLERILEFVISGNPSSTSCRRRLIAIGGIAQEALEELAIRGDPTAPAPEGTIEALDDDTANIIVKEEPARPQPPEPKDCRDGRIPPRR